MQENELSKSYLVALQSIANEISKLRQALNPEKKQMTKEEQAEDVKCIQRDIFGN